MPGGAQYSVPAAHSSVPAAHSSPVAESGPRGGEQQSSSGSRPAAGAGRRASHGTVPRHPVSAAGDSREAAGGGGRRNSSAACPGVSAACPGVSPARQGGRTAAAGQRGSGSYDTSDQRPAGARGEAAGKLGRQQAAAASQQSPSRGQPTGAAAHSAGSVRAKRGGRGGIGSGGSGPGTRRIANSRSSTDLSGGRRLSSARLSHAESDQCLSSAAGCSHQVLGRRLGHSSSSSQLGGRPPTTTPLIDPLVAPPLGRTRQQTGSQQSIESGELLSRPTLASRSEDELSAHSLSPALRRRLRADASTPSSGSGRSQAGSPRAAEVRMRAPAGRRASSGGYLQHDLHRLLTDADGDPDAGPLLSAAGFGSGPIPAAAADGGGSSSRTSPLSAAAETDVLVTTARPAQVVPLPAGQVDWQTLVDTATRAVTTNLPVSR